jgi:hypothetical protein
MTQALYAHMNNKTIKKNNKGPFDTETGDFGWSPLLSLTVFSPHLQQTLLSLSLTFLSSA